jgi:hypothetical protein
VFRCLQRVAVAKTLSPVIPFTPQHNKHWIYVTSAYNRRSRLPITREIPPTFERRSQREAENVKHTSTSPTVNCSVTNSIPNLPYEEVAHTPLNVRTSCTLRFAVYDSKRHTQCHSIPGCSCWKLPCTSRYFACYCSYRSRSNPLIHGDGLSRNLRVNLASQPLVSARNYSAQMLGASIRNTAMINFNSMYNLVTLFRPPQYTCQCCG